MTNPGLGTRANSSLSVSPDLRLRSDQWVSFVGPVGRWQRSVARIGADAERRITDAIGAAQAGEELTEVDELWIEFLRDNMPVSAFAFHHCGRILEAASARSPGGAIAHGIELQASMQLRQAQAIVLYSMDLERRFGPMPIEAARERWDSDPGWQAVRGYLTDVDAECHDWGELLVAINLCFEPIVGQMLRREFAVDRGPAHGDLVTTVVAEAGQREWGLTREWTVALAHFVIGDPHCGDANAATLRAWVARHTPRAEAACKVAIGLADRLPRPLHHERTLAKMMAEHAALLGDAGLAG
jgi:propane monooxygenase small subunit